MAATHRSPKQTIFISICFSLIPFSIAKIHWRLKPKVLGEKGTCHGTFDQNRTNTKYDTEPDEIFQFILRPVR